MSDDKNIYETKISKTSLWTHEGVNGEIWGGKITVHCNPDGLPIPRKWNPRNEKERIRAMHLDDLYQELLDEYNEKNKELMRISRETKRLRRLDMLAKLAKQHEEAYEAKVAEANVSAPPKKILKPSPLKDTEVTVEDYVDSDDSS